MKAKEFTKCLLCGKGVMHAGAPVFLRVKIEYHAMNVGAVQRAAGLEMMVGPLAAVIGPDEDLTEKISEGTGLVCAGCMIEPTVTFALLEAAT